MRPALLPWLLGGWWGMNQQDVGRDPRKARRSSKLGREPLSAWRGTLGPHLSEGTHVLLATAPLVPQKSQSDLTSMMGPPPQARTGVCGSGFGRCQLPPDCPSCRPLSCPPPCPSCRPLRPLLPTPTAAAPTGVAQSPFCGAES